MRRQSAVGDRVLRREGLIAHQVDLGVGEIGLVARQLALGLIQRRLIGARIDLGEQVARLHHLAFGEIELGQKPPTCGRTVAVASGVTVPSALSVTLMGPFTAVATPTGCAP